MAKVEAEQDHVDRWLESVELPGVDKDVEGIVDRINGLRRRFHSMTDETLQELGLGLGEWKVLTHLRLSGPPHRRSAGALSKQAELSSGAMTNRLDRLEEAGLVRRLPDQEDRRGVLVELTPKGRKAYDDAVGAQGRKEALVAAALGDEEKEQLNALLRRLMRAFERREEGESGA